MFVTNLGSDAFVFLTDPELIKEFALQPDLYVKSDEIFAVAKQAFGSGVFTTEGKVWKKHRKIVSGMFHFDFIKTTIPTIVQTTQDVLDRIASKSSVNIMEVFQTLAGEITARVFFGHEFLKYAYNGKSIPVAIANVLKRCMRMGIYTNFIGVWFVIAGILPKAQKAYE